MIRMVRVTGLPEKIKAKAKSLPFVLAKHEMFSTNSSM